MCVENASGNTALHICALYKQVCSQHYTINDLKSAPFNQSINRGYWRHTTEYTVNRRIKKKKKSIMFRGRNQWHPRARELRLSAAGKLSRRIFGTELLKTKVAEWVLQPDFTGLSKFCVSVENRLC